MQCLDHRRFVAQWVVGHKVEVAVCVGGFSVYSCRDGAIWVRWRRTSRNGSLPSDSNSTVNCMLGSTPLRWSKNCYSAAPLSLFITCHLTCCRSHPHLVPFSMHCSLYKASHPLFCTATDEDNRMVVEMFGN